MFANLVPVPEVPPPMSISIRFANPSKKYFPGETVQGKVYLKANEPISARFLKIYWKGVAKCGWYGIESGANKEYVSNYVMAWISEDGKNEIPTGIYRYRFSFQIPADAPPSFSGTFGDIQYSLNVELNRPWRWNIETQEIFKVASKACLAEMAPEMMVPSRFVMHKNSGSIFKDGVFSIEINFPKRAYLAGETIKVSVTMENHSSKPITSMEFELIQQSHFHSRPQKTHCSLNDCLTDCPVPSKYSRDCESVLQTGFHHCYVAPHETKKVTVEVDLPWKLQATFESAMISMGYLVGFTVKNASWTNNKAVCNARIVIGNETNIDGEKGFKALEAPPPYSP
ncbi:hypothetical protein CRE_07674 [Caenorhabditis remanei]|uniref:Arrestin C-terminal-like domain-containing protein n=1 Tax=Caenorhabditis remanei TaxID=31234 RepID=E3MZU5_CAERE|nr:hypothetical protein CRE_07674 [Caenorhabditis remanei]